MLAKLRIFIHILLALKSSIQKPTATSLPEEPRFLPLDLRDCLVALVCAVVAAICWCFLTGRIDSRSWQVPLEYGVKGVDGDAQAVFAHIKAAQEGEFPPFLMKNVSRLGAPYYANWSDIPIVEEWQYYLPGALARWIGLFPATNAAVMLAHVLAVVSFYYAARMLGSNRSWAVAGGFAFGFAQFAFARSIHHLTVTHYWYIPLCLVMVSWITRNQMGEWRKPRYLLSLAACVIIGMQNPYYTNMFLQLVLLGAFYQYFRAGWKPVLQAGGLVVATALGFFLMNLDTLVYHSIHGPNKGALERPYIWLELSALKLVDLLVPPPDHPLLGWMGEAYYGVPGKVKGMVAFPGEIPPSCYLGIVGIASLVWLVVVSVRRLVVEPGRSLPMEAWQVMWILFYAAVGGINCLLGTFGLVIFRSSTRYCIFILPIVLLFAALRLSRKRLDGQMAAVLAGITVMLVLWDQPPRMIAWPRIAEDARIVESDRNLTARLEERLPKGAMVFQLPVMDFPESPAPGVGSYDHYRLYLHSSHLRFSFGAVKGREWTQWPKTALGKTLEEIVKNLEKFGFSAIYVNRSGFADRGEGLLKALAQLGYEDVMHSELGDLYCVLIRPGGHPELPVGEVR